MQARRKFRKFTGPVAIEGHLRKKVLLQPGPKVGGVEKRQIFGNNKTIEKIQSFPPTPPPEVCELSPRISQHEETMEIMLQAPVVLNCVASTTVLPSPLNLQHEESMEFMALAPVVPNCLAPSTVVPAPQQPQHGEKMKSEVLATVVPNCVAPITMVSDTPHLQHGEAIEVMLPVPVVPNSVAHSTVLPDTQQPQHGLAMKFLGPAPLAPNCAASSAVVSAPSPLQHDEAMEVLVSAPQVPRPQKAMEVESGVAVEESGRFTKEQISLIWQEAKIERMTWGQLDCKKKQELVHQTGKNLLKIRNKFHHLRTQANRQKSHLYQQPNPREAPSRVQKGYHTPIHGTTFNSNYSMHPSNHHYLLQQNAMIHGTAVPSGIGQLQQGHAAAPHSYSFTF